MEQLKRCPFCGSDNVGVWHNRSVSPLIDDSYAVMCYDCHFGLHPAAYKENAITAWNTRKPMERILEQLEKLKMAEYDDSDEEPVYEDAEDIFEDGVSSGKFKAYHKAIEIVKKELN